jgi:DNA-binding Lrp family transcriptional regulator
MQWYSESTSILIQQVMSMGRLLYNIQREYYHSIYEEIYKNPTVTCNEIHQNTGISRNTVYKYLKNMYRYKFIRGPYLDMRPAPNYREYVYLMEFWDPMRVFDVLKEVPSIVYHAALAERWNILVISQQRIDFSLFEGFQSVVYQGVKGYMRTPQVENMRWEESFEEIQKLIRRFRPGTLSPKQELAPVLNWQKDEWRLFSVFQSNLRKKMTLLRKLRIPYEKSVKWKENIMNHCTIHTEFYPEGYQKYSHCCFLISSDYKDVVREILSFFPATTRFIDLDDQMLAVVNVRSSTNTKNLFLILYRLEKEGIIREFDGATILLEYTHEIDWGEPSSLCARPMVVKV